MYTKIRLSFYLWIMGTAMCAHVYAQNEQSEYYAAVTFPANYTAGDYIEFLKVHPMSIWSSGYYEVSISYARTDIAAAATHLASIGHSGPDIWREVGRVNSNSYMSDGRHNFTVDCNTEYGNPRFRVRAVNTFGSPAQPITVQIKVTSVNRNSGYTALNVTGNDRSVTGFLPMTDEWSLYTGRVYSTGGASVAIRALANGNVGIGTPSPKDKLSVNGNIRAKEIRVETANWPDYVFDEGYRVKPLSELENFIKEHGHLPGIPDKREAEAEGVDLGEMNQKLLEKVEELTLHLIEEQKARKQLEAKVRALERSVTNAEKEPKKNTDKVIY